MNVKTLIIESRTTTILKEKAMAGQLASCPVTLVQLQTGEKTEGALHTTECDQTHLSLRSLTALTSVENSISITVFFFRSSQIITAEMEMALLVLK